MVETYVLKANINHHEQSHIFNDSNVEDHDKDVSIHHKVPLVLQNLTCYDLNNMIITWLLNQ